jgi:peptide chain release factor 1
MVSVSVLPLPPIKKADAIPDKDLTVMTQRGHGPGGQNVNKVASAVRMVHNPTKITVFINGRDQGRNKVEALRILTARVQQHYEDIESEKYAKLKKLQVKSNRGGDKVRTYNFAKGFVKDHVTEVKTSQVGQVMKGRFELLK